MTKDAGYSLKSISILSLLLEMAVICVLPLIFITHIIDPSPQVVFGGPDFFSATHVMAYAGEIYRMTGAIPRWNPFIGFGEPQIEALGSPVLNPLMFMPIMIWGTVGGMKIAVLLHVILYAIGGWLLGRVLRLDWPGRVLLGLLMAGSGSALAMFATGFVHLAFPQVYIPYVLAGLIGTLYLKRRWPIALVAVGSVLLPFSGGVWYILPLGITAAFLCLFAFFTRDAAGKVIIRVDRIRRMALATVLAGGLVAVRVLTYNREYVYHPYNWNSPPSPLQETIMSYLSPITPPLSGGGQLWITYHFILPWALALGLALARLVVYRPRDAQRSGTWRIIIPAAIVVGILTIWAQGKTPFVDWLYNTFEGLADWKNSGRIAAGATPWIAVFAALMFDDIAYSLLRTFTRRPLKASKLDWLKNIAGLKQRIVLPRPVVGVALFVLFAGGLVGAMDVLHNWRRLVDNHEVNQFGTDEMQGVKWLRFNYGSQFLSVLTQGWITHPGFVEALARTTHGDATIFTLGANTTIGPDFAMRGVPRFAAGTNWNFDGWLLDHQYIPLPGSPTYESRDSAYIQLDAMPYAFVVPEATLVGLTNRALVNSDVQTVSYLHRIDSIIIPLDAYPENGILVIDETNYPGWYISVDGQPARVQSVGGRLAVRLPPPQEGKATTVYFEYKPPKLYLGGAVTALFAFLIAGYLLNLDVRIMRRIPQTARVRVREQALVAARRTASVLTTRVGGDTKADDDEVRLLLPGDSVVVDSTPDAPDHQEEQ